MSKQTNKQIEINNKEAEANFLRPDNNDDNSIFAEEGQLCCDVYQNEKNIIIKSTIAGVEPKNLHISVSNDMLTIRGWRENTDNIKEEDYFCKECYWGTFSRSIVLPQEVNPNKTTASIKNGVLTINMPKKYKSTNIKIKSFDE